MYRSTGDEVHADALITEIQATVEFTDLIPSDTVASINQSQEHVRQVMLKNGAEHPQSLELLILLSDLYVSISYFKVAEDILRRVLLGYKRTFGLQHVSVPTTKTRLAYTLSRQWKGVESEEFYLEALSELLKWHFSPDNMEVMTTIDGLGYVCQMLGKLNESENHYKKLLSCYERELGRNHVLTLEAANSLANVYKEQGRYDEATDLCTASLECCQKTFGNEHPTTQKSVVTLAQIKIFLGKSAEAEKMYQMALKCNEKTLGDNHVDTLSIVCHIASLLSTQGLHVTAENTYRRALSGYELSCGPNSLLVWETAHNLGTTLLAQMKPQDALPLFQRAFDGRGKYLGPLHVLTLYSQFYIGKSYHLESSWRHRADSRAKLQLADSTLSVTLQGYEESVGVDHKLTLEVTQYYADFVLEQDKHIAAETLYRRIYESNKKSLSSNDIKIPESSYRLASILAIRGNHKAAAELYRIAYEGYQTAVTVPSGVVPVPSSQISDEQRSFLVQDAKEQYDNAERMCRF